jgi:hypothetical protein
MADMKNDTGVGGMRRPCSPEERGSRMNIGTRLSVAVIFGLVVLTASTDAKADVVSNPGSFEFDIFSGNDSLFRFASGVQWEIDNGGAGFIGADIDSTGGMSNLSASFGTGPFTVMGTNVQTTLLIQSASSGLIDPSVTDTLQFDLVLKVRFTWGGTVSCSTSAFNVTLDATTWLSETGGGGDCGTDGYNSSTGVYCVAAEGFTIPQLAATACNTHGNDINSAFHLGVSTQTYMQIQDGVVDPVVQ